MEETKVTQTTETLQSAINNTPQETNSKPTILYSYEHYIKFI